MYEGLPLVKLADEKGEGLTYLLRAVYQRQCVYFYYCRAMRSDVLNYHDRYYHRDNNNTPLEVVTSLLLLSTKYDFKHIRTDVILQISKHYPMNLRDYCAMDFDKSKLFGRTREGCHFPLLHAAVTADVDILLPVLYYAASDFSMTAILDHHGDALGIECLKILLKGREKLGLSNQCFGREAAQKVARRCKQDQLQTVFRWRAHPISRALGQPRWISKTFKGKECFSCVTLSFARAVPPLLRK